MYEFVNVQQALKYTYKRMLLTYCIYAYMLVKMLMCILFISVISLCYTIMFVLYKKIDLSFIRIIIFHIRPITTIIQAMSPHYFRQKAFFVWKACSSD